MSRAGDRLIEFTDTRLRPGQEEKIVGISRAKLDGSFRRFQSALGISIKGSQKTKRLIGRGQNRIQFDSLFDFPDRVIEVGKVEIVAPFEDDGDGFDPTQIEIGRASCRERV
jgi:hypothetical protein